MNYQDYNEAYRSYETKLTIPMLFERQVEIFGDKTAAIYRSNEITYEELNRKANQLANLLREKGIGPKKIVGIMVTRSIDMLIAIMGVLKSGGCYLPIDPKFPKSRIEYMLEDSKACLLITNGDLDKLIQTDIEILQLKEDVLKGEGTNLENQNSSLDPAYIIYTSGSTGKPKGVLIHHRAVHNFILGVTDVIDFSADKTIASITTISFDIFTLESLLSLAKGLTILIGEALTFDKDMNNRKVNMIQTTPSTIKLLLNEKQNLKYFEDMTDILVGGEPLSKRVLGMLKEVYKGRIYNMYGPTETTVWSSIKDLTSTDEITIGKPIANTRIYIMSEGSKMLPRGEEGEICIAGDGVALGYIYKEKLTAEKFLPDYFNKEERMYRTGDIGRYLPNGELLCLGRIDSQVKVRGYRIELEEIENVLLKNPDIKECVVSTKKNNEDEKILVGYYIADRIITTTELTQFLKKSMPDYMIPEVFTRIEKIPLTPNGKVNHLALPDIENKRPDLSVEYVAPETEMEKEIASLWCRVLGIDEIGVLDNFFELGGTSDKIAQVYAEMNENIRKQLEIASLFSYPEVRSLCNYILNSRGRIENILESSFYETEICESKLAHLNFKLPSDSSKLTKELLVSLYMYLISESSFSSNVYMICDLGQGFKKVSCDFSTINELEEAIAKIDMSYKENTESFSLQSFRDRASKGEQKLLFTMLFDETEAGKPLENEILVHITQGQQSEMNIYFSLGELRKSKVSDFFTKYTEFITSVMEEL